MAFRKGIESLELNNTKKVHTIVNPDILKTPQDIFGITMLISPHRLYNYQGNTIMFTHESITNALKYLKEERNVTDHNIYINDDGELCIGGGYNITFAELLDYRSQVIKEKTND